MSVELLPAAAHLHARVRLVQQAGARAAALGGRARHGSRRPWGLRLGDIVYADTDDVTRTRALYRAQAARADYAAVVAQMRVVGVWDDHDFGRNDVGSEYPSRTESQVALLDFLGEPSDSPRRGRLGVYASYELGEGDQRVKLIMLDGRYHRDLPSARGDTLGEAQWTWLERELRTSTARLNLVTSGYQVLPLDHSNEKWGNFPIARARLLDLIAATRAAPGVVLPERRPPLRRALTPRGRRAPLPALRAHLEWPHARVRQRGRAESVSRRRTLSAPKFRHRPRRLGPRRGRD